MYYLLTGIIAVSILRYFNLVPKMTSKFYASWKIPGTFYAVNNITNNKTTEKVTSV